MFVGSISPWSYWHLVEKAPKKPDELHSVVQKLLYLLCCSVAAPDTTSPQLWARLLKLRLLRWWAASGFTPHLILPKCSAPLQNKKKNKNPSQSCENNTYFYLRSSISACVWRTVTALRRLFCVPVPAAHISQHRHGSPGKNRLSLSTQPSQIYHERGKKKKTTTKL